MGVRSLFKLKQFLFILLCGQSLIAAAACPTNQVVPFQNLELGPNCSINANFNFGNFSQMVCFTNITPTVGIITWPCNSTICSGQLPLELTTKPTQFSGSFINSLGNLNILNNTTQTLIVSCVYSY